LWAQIFKSIFSDKQLGISSSPSFILRLLALLIPRPPTSRHSCISSPAPFECNLGMCKYLFNPTSSPNRARHLSLFAPSEHSPLFQSASLCPASHTVLLPSPSPLHPPLVFRPGFCNLTRPLFSLLIHIQGSSNLSSYCRISSLSQL
jgi:hypothetical protein